MLNGNSCIQLIFDSDGEKLNSPRNQFLLLGILYHTVRVLSIHTCILVYTNRILHFYLNRNGNISDAKFFIIRTVGVDVILFFRIANYNFFDIWHDKRESTHK